MEGTGKGQGFEPPDESSPVASALPRTIRRIVREELGPLIELLERLGAELTNRRPGTAQSDVQPTNDQIAK